MRIFSVTGSFTAFTVARINWVASGRSRIRLEPAWPLTTFFTGTDMQVVVFVAIITILQAVLNHVGIRVTTFLTDISGYIIFVTTAVLVVACLYFAPSLDFSRLWTFTNFSGEAGGNVFPQSDNMFYLFLLCLLLPVLARFVPLSRKIAALLGSSQLAVQLELFLQ